MAVTLTTLLSTEVAARSKSESFCDEISLAVLFVKVLLKSTLCLYATTSQYFYLLLCYLNIVRLTMASCLTMASDYYGHVQQRKSSLKFLIFSNFLKFNKYKL